ncbi:MAG: hypothetical protein IKH04_13215 [Kiritimatiellae bacterium]|nr:hypothetical protein [Kiritimatiellia bacterium]
MVRYDFWWSAPERPDGSFDFSATDAAVRHGVACTTLGAPSSIAKPGQQGAASRILFAPELRLPWRTRFDGCFRNHRATVETLAGRSLPRT